MIDGAVATVLFMRSLVLRLAVSLLMVAPAVAIATGRVPFAAPQVDGVGEPCACCSNRNEVRRAQRVVRVADVPSLVKALREAQPNDEILIAAGTYRLPVSLNVDAQGLTIRGDATDPGRVVLDGGGMGSGVAVGVSVNVPDVHVEGITIQHARFHGIQVRGERHAHRFMMRRVVIRDAGEQLLKVSAAPGGGFADEGQVLCSEFSYSQNAPSDYTNGVGLLAGRGWTIRGNTFTRIRGPERGGWAAGPAILAWAGAEDTHIESNRVIDSYRGIAVGIVPGNNPFARRGSQPYDHRGAVVRNNVVVNMNAWADEGIEASFAPLTRIEHNTVLVQGRLSWSISARFAATDAVIVNNLTNRAIVSRNGARVERRGNVAAARESWFVQAPGNLRLAKGSPAVDAGTGLADILVDFDGGPRVVGRAPDAGAFEQGAARPAR